MTNMENNTTIISGDAPTNINVVNIHCSLEPSELYVNYFNIFENLVFNISFIFWSNGWFKKSLYQFKFIYSLSSYCFFHFSLNC